MIVSLTFDCETSGLWRDHLDYSDPSQPHLLQLAAKLSTWVDGSPRVEARQVSIIRPDGWAVEPAASLVHGIATARAHRVGVRPEMALAHFLDLAEAADVLIAHGAQFDRKIIAAALYRAGASGTRWHKRAADIFCTMEQSTDIVRLPGQFGAHKWPTLDEAIVHFFPGESRSVQHDAAEDVESTERIFASLGGPSLPSLLKGSLAVVAPGIIRH